MSTWPSADLWRRMAEGILDDLTPCPACQCPAATHYRDAPTSSFKCPPGGDPVKLTETVRRAPKVPNAAALKSRPFPYPTDAAREMERLAQQNPDLVPLIPDIQRIGEQRPGMSTIDVIAEARRQFLDRIEADRLAEVDKRYKATASRLAKAAMDSRLDAAVKAAGDLTGGSTGTGIDAKPQYWRNPATGGEIRGRISAPPRQPAVRTVTKRRFNLDEDE